jgi:hypothetical protein
MDSEHQLLPEFTALEMLHSSIYCQQTKGETEQEQKIIRLFGPFAPHKSQMNFQLGEQQRSRGTRINQ